MQLLVAGMESVYQIKSSLTPVDVDDLTLRYIATSVVKLVFTGKLQSSVACLLRFFQLYHTWDLPHLPAA